MLIPKAFLENKKIKWLCHDTHGGKHFCVNYVVSIFLACASSRFC